MYILSYQLNFSHNYFHPSFKDLFNYKEDHINDIELTIFLGELSKVSILQI